MSNAVILALLSGPAWITADKVVGWWRNHRKDLAEADKVDAEAGLTVDQRWQAWANELKAEVANLRTRVEALEGERERLLERIKGLVAEVDHYRRIGQAMARHVLRLRDALAGTGATIPTLPVEIEDALTIIDMPHGG